MSSVSTISTNPPSGNVELTINPPNDNNNNGRSYTVIHSSAEGVPLRGQAQRAYKLWLEQERSCSWKECFGCVGSCSALIGSVATFVFSTTMLGTARGDGTALGDFAATPGGTALFSVALSISAITSCVWICCRSASEAVSETIERRLRDAAQLERIRERREQNIQP